MYAIAPAASTAILRQTSSQCCTGYWLAGRKKGLFIGSGIVEAACRTDVARRCKQSGMHWRILNAAALCALAARFRSNLPAV